MNLNYDEELMRYADKRNEELLSSFTESETVQNSIVEYLHERKLLVPIVQLMVDNEPKFAKEFDDYVKDEFDSYCQREEYKNEE